MKQERTKNNMVDTIMTIGVFTYGLLWATAALLAPIAIIKLCMEYLMQIQKLHRCNFTDG